MLFKMIRNKKSYSLSIFAAGKVWNTKSTLPCCSTLVLLQDMGDIQENLRKLRALSEDDKSEAAMLRSRIDEQSQLIMILKQVSVSSIVSKW